MPGFKGAIDFEPDGCGELDAIHLSTVGLEVHQTDLGLLDLVGELGGLGLVVLAVLEQLLQVVHVLPEVHRAVDLVLEGDAVAVHDLLDVGLVVLDRLHEPLDLGNGKRRLAKKELKIGVFRVTFSSVVSSAAAAMTIS